MEKGQARLLAATEAGSPAPQEVSNLQMTALQSSHPAGFLLYSPLILSLPIAVHSFFHLEIWCILVASLEWIPYSPP